MMISTWDMQKIRKVKSLFRGGSHPLVLFSLPEQWDAEDRLCTVDETEQQCCEEETTPKNTLIVMSPFIGYVKS